MTRLVAGPQLRPYDRERADRSRRTWRRIAWLVAGLAVGWVLSWLVNG